MTPEAIGYQVLVVVHPGLVAAQRVADLRQRVPSAPAQPRLPPIRYLPCFDTSAGLRYLRVSGGMEQVQDLPPRGLAQGLLGLLPQRRLPVH
jgi:hypothetical protein